VWLAPFVYHGAPRQAIRVGSPTVIQQVSTQQKFYCQCNHCIVMSFNVRRQSVEAFQRMAYELRIHGRPAHQYETSEEAERQARAILADNADSVIEIFDLSTGRPYAPAASAQDRETMSRKIGF
jgi:hypothetical protein